MKKLSHAVYDINLHLVLVTKYRKRCLTASMANVFRAAASRLLNERGAELKEFNGEPDHVHLLLTMPPSLAVSQWVNVLKSVTSRKIRQLFKAELARYYWKPVLWSRSYCVVSCGGAPLIIIQKYLEQQAGFALCAHQPPAPFTSTQIKDLDGALGANTGR